MNKYTIAAVKHNTTVINGITNQALSSGLQKIILSGSGQVNPSFTGVTKISPQLTFTTNQVKTALGALGGISGIAIAAANFTFWLQKITEAVSRAASSHIKITGNTGIIIPQTLTIPDGGEASLTYQAILTSADGTTSPLVRTDSQALDVGQAGAAEAYTLGAVTLNGTTIDNPANVTINFGLAVDVSGSKTYPTDVAILKQQPTISIDCFDIDETIANVGWGLPGQAQNDTDSVINLDDILEGGVRGSTPITFTIDEGHMNFNDISGGDGAKVGTNITLTPTFDGTAAILVVGGI